MRIILKHIFKSIMEKKGRTILIIISIMIAPALFFSSLSISSTMVKMQMDSFRSIYGYSDIIIEKNFISLSPYFDIRNAADYTQYTDYIIGEVSGYCTYSYGVNQKEGIALRGIDLKDLNKIQAIDFVNNENLDYFDSMKIIIGKPTADKFGLSLGQAMILQINGNKYKFVIWGIAQPKGAFAGDASSSVIVMSRDTAATIYNVRGRVNEAYIKLKDPTAKSQMISALSSVFPKYTVREPFNENELKSQNDKIAIPYLVLTLILSFMSIYIIYTMSNVIVLERLPIIGTLRSIGIQKRKTTFLLLSESVIYGIIGALLSCPLGIGILYLISFFTRSGEGSNMGVSIVYNNSTLLYTALMALALTFISSIIPILSVVKISIKDIILNSLKDKNKKGIIRTILGLLFIAAVIIFPRLYTVGSLGLIVNILCEILSIFSIVLLVPAFTKLMIFILEKFYGIFFKNEGIIAIKNIKDNEDFLKNISLILIAISSVIMVKTISHSTIDEIKQFYESHNYQLSLYMENINASRLGVIKSVNGVKDTMGVLYINFIPTLENTSPITQIEGINVDKYLDFVNPQMLEGSSELFKQLNDSRYMIIGRQLQIKYSCKVGDVITLNISGQPIPYKVIGVVNTIERGGDISFISEFNYMHDFKGNNYPIVYIKTDKDIETTEKNIKSELSKLSPKVFSEEYLEESVLRSNNQILIIIQGFSLMSALAGVLGVFNNFFIHFIKKKRYIAMYRSIGMSRKQLLKVNLIEAFTVGMIGGILGVVTSLLMLSIVPNIIKLLNMLVDIKYSITIFIVCFIVSILISIAGSLVPTIKSSKVDIIEAIKYE